MLSLDLPQALLSQKTINHHRILVVGDEDVIRDMIVIALEGEGYEVVSAPDGRTALNFFQEKVSAKTELEFHLVVLDLMLP